MRLRGLLVLSTGLLLLAGESCVLTPSTGYGRACDADDDCDDDDVCDAARGFCVPADSVGEGEGEGEEGEGEEGEGEEGEGEEGEGEEGEGEGEGEGEVDFFRIRPVPPQSVNEDTELALTLIIDNPPAAAQLSLSATSVLGAAVSVGADDVLRYLAPPDVSGDDVVTVTANAGDDSAFVDIAVAVVPVDDPPSFLPVSVVLNTQEDVVSASTVVASAPSAGPSDEAGQTVGYDVEATAGADLVESAVVDAATGRLTVVPAANRFGSATLRVTIVDEGGPGNFSDVVVNIAGQNDNPIFTNGGPFTLNEDQVVDVVVGSLIGGPFEEGQPFQNLDVEVRSDNNNVVENGSPIAELVGDQLHVRCVLHLDATGTFTLNVDARDEGGGVFGGGSRNANEDFVFNVVAVADGPTLTSPTRMAAEPGHPRATGVVVDDPEGGTVTVTIESQPANGAFSLSTVGPTTTLVFTPGATAGRGSGTLRLSSTSGASTVATVQTLVGGAEPSCFHARALGLSFGDGVYDLLQPEDATAGCGVVGGCAYRAFCDMTHDGGGWTLALKADGNSDTFRFADARWTNTALLSEDAATAADLVVGPNAGAGGEAKLNAFNSVKVDRIRVGLAPRTTGSRAFVFVDPDVSFGSTVAPSLRTVFSVTNTGINPPGLGDYDDIDAAFTGMPTACVRAGINRGDGQNPAVRIGVVSDSQFTCASIDDYIGIGSTFAGSSAGARKAGVNLPRHGALLVRSFDLTEVKNPDNSAFANCAAVKAAGFSDVDALYTVNGAKVRCPP